MYITLILMAVGIVSLAVFLLCFNVIFRKGGKFPETHIGKNQDMAKKGISCAASQDNDLHTQRQPIKKRHTSFLLSKR